MDIDIDICRIHIEVEEIGNLHSLRHQSFVSTADSLMKIGLSHITAIDEEIIVSALLPGRLRFPHEARDTTDGCIYLYRQEFLTGLLPEHVSDTLTQWTCLQVHLFLSVAIEHKTNFRIDKYDTLKSREDIIQFRGIGLQELPACRHIKEEVLNLEVRTYRTGSRFLTNHP